MNKKIMAIVTVLCIAALMAPVFADVYIPPGGFFSSTSDYTVPYLCAIDMRTMQPIGAYWTEGSPNTVWDPSANNGMGAYATFAQRATPIQKGVEDIPWGDKVTILGFYPGVAVSADQVPPAIELKITWGGIPNLITLSTTNQVGLQYPPTIFPDIKTLYQFAWPASSPSKDATYNIWVGDYAYIYPKFRNMFGFGSVTPAWFENQYGNKNGLWFWYTFMPNVGDWIAVDSVGRTKFAPTYDVTALLEYGTHEVWTNHIMWDVSLLELHKDVSFAGTVGLNDMITIINVGLRDATGLTLTQTFPWLEKWYINPVYAKACIAVKGPTRSVGPVPLADFYKVANPSVFTLPAPFDVIKPGEIMTITMPMDGFWLDDPHPYNTIVWDMMLTANEIAPWNYPLAVDALVWSVPTEPSFAYLWTGWYLRDGALSIEPLGDTYPTPFLRTQLIHSQPAMVLDPEPVPLIAGETKVTAADVKLVQAAVVGLASYDVRMDCNGNGRIDLEDLKLFELAVG